MSDLTLWACWGRIRILSRFAHLVRQYSVDTPRSRYLPMSEEDKRLERKELRTQINQMLPKASRLMREAGIYPNLIVSTPRAVGGRVFPNYDAMENLFYLDYFEVPLQIIIDYTDRAIGYYKDEQMPAFFRTINPFWWLWQLSKAIIRIPFVLLAWAGFNAERIEQLPVAAGYKRLASLVGFVAALIATLGALAEIINVLDLAEKVQKWLFG